MPLPFYWMSLLLVWTQARAEFQETLDGLRSRGKAILMSTHDIFRAKEIANRVGIMKEGRLIMQRTHDELEHEDLEALYLDYMRGGYKTDDDADRAARAM